MGSLSVRRRVVGRVLTAATTVPTTLGSGFVTLLTSYLGLLSICGTVAQRRTRVSDAPPPGSVRFAILVPAHDEEAGIERALRTMLDLDYPSDAYEIHVVADNCSDRTIDVVRAVGAFGHERIAADDPGKGAALNWLHDQLVAREPAFDAYVIVDADTSLDRRFLAEMERAFLDGAVAAQGFYDVRDADQSAAAGLRAAALACRHHLRPLGRRAIGASCGLYGNGMAFTADLLADRRWSGHLTEDLEFQIDLVLDGHLVTYVPGARLEAEIPHDLDASVNQNQRWERGRVQVARSSLPALVRRLVRHRPRIATADAIADQLVPPLSVLAAAQVAVDLAGCALLVIAPSRRHRRLTLVNVLSTLTLAGHVVAGLRSVGAPSSVYRSMAQAPRMVIWKVRLWLGVLGEGSEVAWSRTERNEVTAPDTTSTRDDASVGGNVTERT